jgi:hypothetical protein
MGRDSSVRPFRPILSTVHASTPVAICQCSQVELWHDILAHCYTDKYYDTHTNTSNNVEAK